MKCYLGDVCHFYSGTGFSVEYQGKSSGELPFYKVGDISNNTIAGYTRLRMCSNYISRQEANKLKGSILPPDTVVFAKIGEALKFNRRAITKCDCLVDNNVMGIAPNPEILRIDYFFYFMKQLRMQDLAESTTVPSVRKSKLERVEIAVPSMEEQIEIERKIQLTDSIIQKRKQQLSALDNLIKARFVEMFGDPISNEREWPTAPLTDVCTRIFGGGTPSKSHPEYFEGTIPWVSPKDMKSDIITDSIDHITEDALANSTTNLVPEGSVLMVIRSGILKHALPVAINAIPVTINQDMKAFIPSKNITSNFLRNYFKAVEQDILVGVRGVTADNIDFKSFQQREIILPPIELQNLFSDFVVQVDKSKVVIQKALDEAQILFDSLMQQYFG